MTALSLLQGFSPVSLERIQYVFSDVDGTLTYDGRLPARTLASLEALHARGYRIVLVSGGSAGTALHGIRAWPVDAFITESGAMAYYRDDGGAVAEWVHPDAAEAEAAGLSRSLIHSVEREIPESRLARDQFTRRFDVAFDYNEEKPPLHDRVVDQIQSLAKGLGASVYVSSIHINCWFGQYSKLLSLRQFLMARWRLSLEKIRDVSCFVGDAPNDQEMFRFFPLSVGVAGVKDFADKMEFLPAFVTSFEGGEGFAEFADLLIKKKGIR